MIDEKQSTLRQDLAALLNRHSVENRSDTPDWILAEFLLASLEAWDQATYRREQWHDRPVGHLPFSTTT